MMKNKIRLALTVLIILALFTGLVISTVDAKSGTSGKGKGFGVSKGGVSLGKGLGVGKTTVRGISDPGFSSFSLKVNPTSVGNAFTSTRYGSAADSFAVSTDGFRVKTRSLNIPVDSTGLSVDTLKVNVGPTAIGNALSLPSQGITDSFAASTDGFLVRSVDVRAPLVTML